MACVRLHPGTAAYPRYLSRDRNSEIRFHLSLNCSISINLLRTIFPQAFFGSRTFFT